jgi:hypothetical protein
MSISNTLTTDFTLRLRDGRTMGVALVGPSDGFPIFHCHGSGSSRLEVNLKLTIQNYFSKEPFDICSCDMPYSI